MLFFVGAEAVGNGLAKAKGVGLISTWRSGVWLMLWRRRARGRVSAAICTDLRVLCGIEKQTRLRAYWGVSVSTRLTRETDGNLHVESALRLK
ncbi:hypothetical protein PT2222_290092 [Paraburkholderia tropica]